MGLRTWSILAALVAGLGLHASAAGAPRPPIGADPVLDRPLGRLPFDPLRRVACGSLSGLALDHGAIISATVISGGSFTPPGWTAPLIGLPTFCRVVAAATPTTDSLIGIEVWIPYDGSYRQRYLQVGNGGFSGAVVYAALADGIRRGYATASTDDGSQMNGSAAFAAGHPEKVIDYGHRALKQTNDKAKAIIRALMGRAPDRSYFHGCSNGGREALMMAQRYPDDFDGVAAGAPANNFTRQFTAFVWNTQRTYPPGSVAPNLAASRSHILSDAVRAQCAGHDGGLPTDRFLTDPTACRVDFAAVACAPGEDPATCLSATEIDTARSIYEGPVHTATHAQIYPGFEPGAEDHPCNWGLWITGKTAGDPRCAFEPAEHIGFQAYFGWAFFGYFVHGTPAYDVHTMNFGSDVDSVDAALGPILNATDPDLRAFRNRGGKLIQYHGFDDAAVAPQNSIDYWAAVDARMRATTPGFTRADLDGFYRLFMAPGMAHCAGGDGATAFGNLLEGSAPDADHDLMRALERWVEDGAAPQRIVARHISEGPGDPYFERPLCPYPKLPRYSGAGDPSEAARWNCVAPRLTLRDVRERLLRDRPIIIPRD